MVVYNMIDRYFQRTLSDVTWRMIVVIDVQSEYVITQSYIQGFVEFARELKKDDLDHLSKFKIGIGRPTKTEGGSLVYPVQVPPMRELD